MDRIDKILKAESDIKDPAEPKKIELTNILNIITSGLSISMIGF